MPGSKFSGLQKLVALSVITLIALIAVSTVPLPVMMMTCGGSGSARRCLSVSRPSISGMTMSTNATSNA